MRVTIRRLIAAIPLIAAASLHAQAPTPPQDLSAFEGTYLYRDGGSLTMVVDRERLVAIIGDAKYPLRAVATDTFANAGGDRIPFARDAAGRVAAFREHGDTFARLSAVVAVETRRLLVPRPPGPEGRPPRHRCVPPPALSDGIRVGATGPGTLSCAIAARLVNGVIDGTYPEIRAIAVHHRGALVLEEYFYGYERDRLGARLVADVAVHAGSFA